MESESMEVIEANEAWTDKDNDLVFDHSKIILRRKYDGQLFFARTPHRLRRNTVTAKFLEGLELTKIPAGDVFPPFDDAKHTRAPHPLPGNAYIKRQSLLDYGYESASSNFTNLILSEVEVCEQLAKHPHPNLAQYLGCVVEDGRITGLCFRRYTVTLLDKVSSGDPFDKEACLRGIEDGIKHLHQLGLVHNDLNPTNIMVHSDGSNPVIIDFDSCRPEGQEVPLGGKMGTMGWADEGITHAKKENDFQGLAKIKEFLMEGDGSGEKEA